jgi:hypothetical protein
MNNSSYKSNLMNGLNNLSETSNNFLSEINQMNKNKIINNINYHNLSGGSKCFCNDAFKAFNSDNLDLALYILKDCCFLCKDNNGNTLLHHLVSCCTNNNNNDKCLSALSKVLSSPSVSKFINIQNSNGTTPILLAVQENNELVANLLDEAGADTTIADNSGNYLHSKDMSDNKSFNVSETPNEQKCVNNLIKIVISKVEPELSTLNLSSSVNDNNLNEPLVSEKVLQKLAKTFANSKLDDVSSLGLSSSENYLDTDRFINFLSDKYNKQKSRNNTDLIEKIYKLNLDNHNVNDNDDVSVSDDNLSTETLVKNVVNNLKKQERHKEETKEETKPIVISDADNINTDDLMRVIENINTSKKMDNVNIVGGAKKEKTMGYRNMILHSDNSDNILERVNENFVIKSKKSKLSKYSKSKKSSDLSNLDLYYSDSNVEGSTNELSRLINSRKNDLHNEVINMIMGMLNKGLITKNSKPIEADEKNAKLIKSYLYRVVSEKNPQLTGMDKILMIKKMNDKEIIDTLYTMPDLDELEENIRKHIEEKQKNKMNTETDTDNSTNDSVVETDDKPKKKSSKKMAVQSRTKKVPKKLTVKNKK